MTGSGETDFREGCVKGGRIGARNLKETWMLMNLGEDREGAVTVALESHLHFAPAAPDCPQPESFSHGVGTTRTRTSELVPVGAEIRRALKHEMRKNVATIASNSFPHPPILTTHPPPPSWRLLATKPGISWNNLYLS